MTEEEFRTGNMNVTPRLGRIEPSRYYMADALRTLSPKWHGDKVSKAQFNQRINRAIDALNQLDQVKKTLFYGRDNNLIADGQNDVSELYNRVGSGGVNGMNLIHAIIGIATEAGEMLEALRTAYNQDEPGNTFDSVNAREETGDCFWYQAILANECGFTFEDAMAVNIAKLRARFPERFTEDNANTRDLDAERAILEGGVTDGSSEDFQRMVQLAMNDKAATDETLVARFRADYGNEGKHSRADYMARLVSAARLSPFAKPVSVAEQGLPVNYRTRKMEGERNLDGNAIEAQK